MGQGASKNAAVSDVLKLAAQSNTNNEPKEEINLSQDEINDRLTKLGVDPTSASSDDEKKLCLSILLNDCNDFWRKHHRSHPNSKRVKMWLMVHERYRTQLAHLVVLAEEAATSSAKENAMDNERHCRSSEKLQSLQKQFEKFAKKIIKHSKFEEDQLFPFFRERVFQKGKISSTNNDNRNDGGDDDADDDDLYAVMYNNLTKLSEQHDDDNHSKMVTEAMKNANGEPSATTTTEQGERKTKDGDLLSAVRSYRDFMLKHLELEEQTLVTPWLALNDELYYGTYRKEYLKFPYSFMY